MEGTMGLHVRGVGGAYKQRQSPLIVVVGPACIIVLTTSLRLKDSGFRTAEKMEKKISMGY